MFVTYHGYDEPLPAMIVGGGYDEWRIVVFGPGENGHVGVVTTSDLTFGDDDGS